MKKSLIALVGCSLFASSVSCAPNPQKIMTVDLSRVFERYEVAKKARDVYNTDLSTADKELQSMYEEAVKLSEDLQNLMAKADNVSLTDGARQKFKDEAAKKADLLKAKEGEFSQLRQEVGNKFNERRQKEVSDQAKVIENAINAIAKDKKADMVINKSACVLFVDDSLDMTDLVLNKLNKK